MLLLFLLLLEVAQAVNVFSKGSLVYEDQFLEISLRAEMFRSLDGGAVYFVVSSF